MIALVHALQWLSIAMGCLCIGFMSYKSFFGLRAKAQLRRILAAESPADAPAPTLDEARARIERALPRLAPRDQALIRSGLTQPSRTGEQRFVRELTS